MTGRQTNRQTDTLCPPQTIQASAECESLAGEANQKWKKNALLIPLGRYSQLPKQQQLLLLLLCQAVLLYHNRADKKGLSELTVSEGSVGRIPIIIYIYIVGMCVGKYIYIYICVPLLYLYI